MPWHFIEGEAGCRYAVQHGCVAVVVDALRASATAAMLLDAGATRILAVREVAEAREMALRYPDALLYGERGGVPPEGFDYGNSPREAHHARGRRVIFTTTTGAGRLVACWGAAAVYMGTTVNAAAVSRAAMRHGRDVVLIPAGLTGEVDFDAQEDRAAAAAVLMATEAMGEVMLGEGARDYQHWRKRIVSEGLDALFATAPHAEKLRAIGMDQDIAYCSRLDLTIAVPMAVAQDRMGVVLREASEEMAADVPNGY